MCYKGWEVPTPGSSNGRCEACDLAEDIQVNTFQTFILRAILGAVFAVVISRFFYPRANLYYVAGLGVILVGLAYFAEYLRVKRTNRSRGDG